MNELIEKIKKMKEDRTVELYRSKNAEDWHEAKVLLMMAEIEFHDWTTEEPPVSGGYLIDIRTVGRKDPIPTTIYHIEVFKRDEGMARMTLYGKVLPKLSYGPCL